jgi:anti-sigma regulatory factor (Ser/Thr protein kinase)
MRGADTDICLSLPARAENVGLVRHVVAAVAEAVGLPADTVEDIRLAVTEACTNVVRHAYGGREGPMEVQATPGEHELTVTVADRGRGIRPDPAGEGPGLGLPLIATLTADLEVDIGPERGSRLSMCFRAPGGSTLQTA